jgi:UDP-N-acetylmuramoyl-tripeptide--D-alanyl-D-alanine ligase
LLAIALARAADVPWEILGKSLENMKFPPMRWQQKTVNGFTIVNDAYNASPPSMAGALRTFAVLPGATRRVVVLGDMLELGTAEESLHREIGRMVAQAPCQALVCVGRRAKWIADEAIATGFPAQQVWRYADAATAATDTTAWMRPGDAVLLKASRGMGLERVATALAGEHAGEGDGHGG